MCVELVNFKRENECVSVFWGRGGVGKGNKETIANTIETT